MLPLILGRVQPWAAILGLCQRSCRAHTPPLLEVCRDSTNYWDSTKLKFSFAPQTILYLKPTLQGSVCHKMRKLSFFQVFYQYSEHSMKACVPLCLKISERLALFEFKGFWFSLLLILSKRDLRVSLNDIHCNIYTSSEAGHNLLPYLDTPISYILNISPKFQLASTNIIHNN